MSDKKTSTSTSLFTTEEITHLLLAETIQVFTEKIRAKKQRLAGFSLEDIWEHIDKKALSKAWFKKLRLHSVPYFCGVFIFEATEKLKEFRPAFDEMLSRYAPYFLKPYCLKPLPPISFFWSASKVTELRRPVFAETADLSLRDHMKIEHALKPVLEEERYKKDWIRKYDPEDEIGIPGNEFFKDQPGRFWQMEMFQGFLFRLTVLHKSC